MMFVNSKPISDPVLMTPEDVSVFRAELPKKFWPFFIPIHIISNKDKKDYKTGFLNEIYSLVFPESLKKNIFTEVTKKFDIFVDERQYQNMVAEYNLKKYSFFIKKSF